MCYKNGRAMFSRVVILLQLETYCVNTVICTGKKKRGGGGKKKKTKHCPGKQSKPASFTTVWLGDGSRVVPVLAVQLSQSSPISQMTQLEKYIPELVIHPLELPKLPIWDHRCWLNPQRKRTEKDSKMKNIRSCGSKHHQASAEVALSANFWWKDCDLYEAQPR